MPLLDIGQEYPLLKNSIGNDNRYRRDNNAQGAEVNRQGKEKEKEQQ